MALADDIGIVVAVIMSLIPYTYLLWKENIVFRFAEHLMMGTYLGYIVVQNWYLLNSMVLSPIAAGSLYLIIPLVVGCFQYSIWFTKWRWMVRYPYAVIVGALVGLTMRGLPESQILGSIYLTANMYFEAATAMDWFTAIVVSLSVLTPIIYFTYTREHKGPYGTVAKVGRYFLMAGFGAFYMNVSMTRLAYTVALIKWLFQTIGIVEAG